MVVALEASDGERDGRFVVPALTGADEASPDGGGLDGDKLGSSVGEVVAGLGRAMSTKRPHPVPLVGGSVTLIGIGDGKNVGGPEGASDSTADGFPVGAAAEGKAVGLARPPEVSIVGEAEVGDVLGAPVSPPIGAGVIDGDAVGAAVGSRLSTPAS